KRQKTGCDFRGRSTQPVFAIGSARGMGDLRASYSAPRTSWHLRGFKRNDDERNSNDVLRLNVAWRTFVARESSFGVDNRARVSRQIRALRLTARSSGA